MTLEDHLIKALYDFMEKSPSSLFAPTKFVGHKHCCSGDILVLVYHVTLQDHVIKGRCHLMGRSQSRSVIILQNLVVMATLVVKSL